MKNKLFHNIYNGTARILYNEDCTECENKNVHVVRMSAEINAGEHYTVEICQECIEELLKRLINY